VKAAKCLGKLKFNDIEDDDDVLREFIALRENIDESS